MGIVDAILGVIGSILYPMFSIVFVLIDGIQAIFQAFAGIGDVKLGGSAGSGGAATTISGSASGKEENGGLLYYLLQTNMIKNIFFSILVLALFLIIIFTAMAFIKNTYSSKPKKWQDIVGNAFIGLANFVFVPVCCLLGVFLGNVLLKAIDGATNVTGATSMGRMLFVSAAYNANHLRQEDDRDEKTVEQWQADVQGLIDSEGLSGKITIVMPNGSDDEKLDYLATVLDQVYAQSDLNIYWAESVNNWYDLINMNYILMVGGGIFMIYVLAAISFGMVKRLFILLMLFVISPGLCAMYPLDDGGAVKKWKDDFVKNTISAYGAVAGMNLFFAIVPFVQDINLYGSGNGALSIFASLGLTQILLTIAGLYVVKDFISMISGYIGAGNAYADGSGLMGQVKGRMKQGAGWVGKRAKNISTAFAHAAGAKKAGGSFFGDLIKGSAVDGLNNAFKGLTGVDIKGAIKDSKDAADKGEKDAIEKQDKKLKKAWYGQDEDGNTVDKDAKENGKLNNLDRAKNAVKNKNWKELEDIIEQASYVGISEQELLDKIFGNDSQGKRDSKKGLAGVRKEKEQVKHGVSEAVESVQESLPDMETARMQGFKNVGLSIGDINTDGISEEIVKAIQKMQISGNFVQLQANDKSSDQDKQFVENWNADLDKIMKTNSSAFEGFNRQLEASKGYITRLGERYGFAEDKINDLIRQFEEAARSGRGMGRVLDELAKINSKSPKDTKDSGSGTT